MVTRHVRTVEGETVRLGDPYVLENERVVWDDMLVSGATAVAGATAPDFDSFGPSGGLKTYLFAGSGVLVEEVHFQIQISHRLKENAKYIYPHVHWTPTDTNTGNVVWSLEYSWADINQDFAAPTSMDSIPKAAGGAAWQHLISSFGPLDNSHKISSILVCRLYRDPAHTLDTYAQDAALLYFDIHYPINSMGSRQEYIK